MAIHTFGEYLDFHPHLHALVADGLFDREGKFHVMRGGEDGGEIDALCAGNHAALEQLFRARVIAFLVEAGLLPLDRARMLRGWVHSGFQVHQSRRIAANECQDMERLAQYIGVGKAKSYQFAPRRRTLYSCGSRDSSFSCLR